MCALPSSMLAAFLVVVCAQVSAAPPQTSLAPRVRTLAPAAAPATVGTTTVFGYVWNASNEPIAFAHVQLRNVSTGAIEASAVAAETGEFRFETLEGGTYVIEYVDEKGKVLAVGHVFSVAPGETVATFIRLGNRAPWYAALLGDAGNAAALAVAAAASLGVTALAPASRPVSPER